MLCIAKVRGGGHTYYLDVVDCGSEAPGQWLSAGSRRLGLSGTVEGGDLEAVLAGADPSSGSHLGGARSRVTVAGFDLTFCAPKSVSLLNALADDDVSRQVGEAHRAAVTAALSYVERHALAVRRGTGVQRAPQAVDGVAAAGFVHRVSRALDPHLHTHTVVANLGMARDGSWSALDGRGVYAHRAAAGALYHAQLRHELTARIGVEWDPPDRGRADISGIGPEVRRSFSRRAAAIEAHLAGRGLVRGRGRDDDHELSAPGPYAPSSRARTVAALATRAPRDVGLDPESLRPAWRRRALEAGLSPRHLEAALGRAPTVSLENDAPERGDVRKRVEASLSELGRSVARRDVIRAWCSQLERGGRADDIERAADDFVGGLQPVAGRPTAELPGVAERRHLVGERHLESASLARGGDSRDVGSAEVAEQRRIDRILDELGMSRAQGRELGRERGPGLEMSW